MAERLGVVQSDVLQEPSGRPKNVGQNSTSREPQITRDSQQEHTTRSRAAGVAALGGLALIVLSVACGDGNAQTSKTPSVDSSVVSSRTVDNITQTPAPKETPANCDITQDKLNEFRKINGENWWEALSKKGDLQWKEVFESIQYTDEGMQKYLHTFGGDKGVYAKATNINTGEEIEVRTPQEFFSVAFPNGVQPGDEEKAIAYMFMTNKNTVTQLGGRNFPDKQSGNIAGMRFNLGYRDLFHEGPTPAAEIVVSAPYGGFSITSTQLEDLGKIDDKQCIEEPQI